MHGPKGVDKESEKYVSKIPYYSEHPELVPPPMIRNMVKLHQKMKNWDTTGYNPDIFSDEEEDESAMEEEQVPIEKISVSSTGIRLSTIFITDKMLSRTDFVQIEEIHGCRIIRFIASSADQVQIYPDIPLPKDHTPNQVLKAIEQWKREY